MKNIKCLVNQKIKELASANNEMAREIIENIYKELEEEKRQNISYLQIAIESNEKKQLEEKANKLKTAVEYFDEIILADIPSRYILENLIDKIWIYSDKSVKFDLKVDIENLI